MKRLFWICCASLLLVSTRASAGQPVKATVTVRNSGARAGEEVVQLYARAPQGDGRPLKELRGFQRVHLQPGEARDVVFTRDPGKDLRHYDEQAQAYAVVPGEYELQVGASSADIRARTRLAVEQD